jgi:rubredoxin
LKWLCRLCRYSLPKMTSFMNAFDRTQQPDPNTCRICGGTKAPTHFVCRNCFNRLPRELRAPFAVARLKCLAWLREHEKEKIAAAGNPGECNNKTQAIDSFF